MNAFWKIWIVLLTLWVAFDAWTDHNNLQLRNERTIYRDAVRDNQAEFNEHQQEFNKEVRKIVNANAKQSDEQHKALTDYINGPLRDELNEMRTWLHKH